MDKQGIKKDANDYLFVAENMKGLRPFFHIVSAVTTFCFVAALLAIQTPIAGFCEAYPALGYTLVSIASATIAAFYEIKVSGIITSLGIVITNWHSKRMVILVSAVAIPLIFIAGATSFIGINEASYQAYAIAGAVTTEQMQGILEGNSLEGFEVAKQRQEVLLSNRKTLRSSVINQYKSKIARVGNESDALYLEGKMAKELQSFDKETSQLCTKIDTEVMGLVQKGANTADNFIIQSVKEKEQLKSRMVWIGQSCGYIAIICLVLSVFCSIGERWVRNVVLQGDGGGNHSNSKGGRAPSPTLGNFFSRFNLGQKRQKKDIPLHVHSVGEGLGGAFVASNKDNSKEYIKLRDEIKGLNTARIKLKGEGAEKMEERMNEEIDKLNQLGYDVQFDDNDKLIFDAFDKPSLI